MSVTHLWCRVLWCVFYLSFFSLPYLFAAVVDLLLCFLPVQEFPRKHHRDGQFLGKCSCEKCYSVRYFQISEEEIFTTPDGKCGVLNRQTLESVKIGKTSQNFSTFVFEIYSCIVPDALATKIKDNKIKQFSKIRYPIQCIRCVLQNIYITLQLILWQTAPHERSRWDWSFDQVWCHKA